MDNTTCEDVRYAPVRHLKCSQFLLGDDGEPEWMLEFAKRESSRAITEKRKELEERLAKTRLEEEKQRLAIENAGRPHKKQVCYDIKNPA